MLAEELNPPYLTRVFAMGGNMLLTALAIGKPLRFMYNAAIWKRGRVVEGTSLENWRRVTLFVSSNLTASANHIQGCIKVPHGTVRKILENQ